MDVPPSRAVPPDPLARLEARVRWLTALSSFLTLGFVSLLAWQFLPRPKIVEAHSFVLRDSAWRRRAVLGLREDESPILRFNNAKEKDRLTIFLRPNGEAVIRLTDTLNVHRARLALEESGKPVLLLNGPDGHSRVSIAPVGEGYSGIQLRGAESTPLWKAP